MNNVIWGCGVVLLTGVGFLYGFRQGVRGRFERAILCFMICGLILRVFTAADGYLHEWDERYHALVAKHLSQHFLVPTLYDHPVLPYDYRSWSSNHIWLHKQPLSLWLMAGSIKLFGLHAFSVRIPAIVLSAIGIKLVGDIAKDWFGKQVALIAAFLWAIHGLILELAAGRAATDAVDVVFLSFIVLSIWLAVKAIRKKSAGFHLVAGAALGLAILTKWLPALICLPVWACLAYPAYRGSRRRMMAHAACIVFAAAAISIPWQLYILHAFPLEAQWEYRYNSMHLFHAIESHEGGFFYHFDHLRMKYGELVYLPVAWFTGRAFKSRKSTDLALLTWFWGPYLFFSLAATKMEAYTLIAAPAVFIITGIAFVRLAAYAKEYSRYRIGIQIIRACLVLLPVRYSLERIKPFTVLDRDPEWNREIKALGRNNSVNNRTVFVHCRHPVELMFYTDAVAYEQQVDTATRGRLIRADFVVVDCEQ